MVHDIRKCPTCGSPRIKVVKKDVHGLWGGKYPYVAKDVVYHECPVCGEHLYGPQAMRRIESFRPRIRVPSRRRRAS